jgi:hypothetical protein
VWCLHRVRNLAGLQLNGDFVGRSAGGNFHVAPVLYPEERRLASALGRASNARRGKYRPNLVAGYRSRRCFRQWSLPRDRIDNELKARRAVQINRSYVKKLNGGVLGRHMETRRVGRNNNLILSEQVFH